MPGATDKLPAREGARRRWQVPEGGKRGDGRLPVAAPPTLLPAALERTLRLIRSMRSLMASSDELVLVRMPSPVVPAGGPTVADPCSPSGRRRMGSAALLVGDSGPWLL